MSRFCGPKVERRPPNTWLPAPTWASREAALRKLGTRAPGHRCQISLDRFWQVSTLTVFSFLMFFVLTSTRSQFRHLVLRAVPVFSSSPKAWAWCASLVFGSCCKSDCLRNCMLMHAELQYFKVQQLCSSQETWYIFTSPRWTSKLWRKQPSWEYLAWPI